MSPVDVQILLASYFARVERGERLAFEEWVREHPDRAIELRRLYRMRAAGEDTGRDSDTRSVFFRSGRPRLAERSAGKSAREAGQKIGDFRLVRLIDRGGMGEVWEAEEASLRRRVALKVILPERVNDRGLRLFAREARAGGRLEHPGIVRVYSFGESDGTHWIAQELVEGGWTLRDFLEDARREESLPDTYYQGAATFFASLANALQVAHEAGVVHRDVKPQNILVTAEDEPKLTDFGLARITDEPALSVTGDFAGTYLYMSPEQVAARRAGIDYRTDIFSLGVVLYETLSLERPFKGDTAHEIANQILVVDPPRLESVRAGVPRDLAVICRKCLEKDRERRYPSMALLAADLERFSNGQPVLASPPSLGRRIARGWSRRRAGEAGSSRLDKSAGARRVLGLSPSWLAAASAVGLLAFPILWWTRAGTQLSGGLRTHPEIVSYAMERIDEFEKRDAGPTARQEMRIRLAGATVERASISTAETLAAAVAAIPELAAFPIIVDPSAERAFSEIDAPLSLDLQFPIRADQLLELLLRTANSGLYYGAIDWDVDDGRATLFGYDYFRPLLEQRFYLVQDFMAFEPYDENDVWQSLIIEPDDLAILIQESVGIGTWERDGAMIAIETGTLLIVNREEVLSEVDFFLSILRRGMLATSSLEPLEWRLDPLDLRDSELRGSLVDQLVELDDPPGSRMALAELAAAIEEQVEIDVVIDFSESDEVRRSEDTVVRVDITEGSLSRVLTRVFSQLDGAEWAVHHGVLVFTAESREPLVGRVYPVWDLIEWSHVEVDGRQLLPELGVNSAVVMDADSLYVLVMDTIASETWDSDPRRSLRMSGMGLLVVVQSRRVQEKIEDLLNELRRLRSGR